MPAGAYVCGGVPVRRGVTASHMTAAAAHPQMHPRASDRQAVLAPDDLLGPRDEDLLEMRAGDHHDAKPGLGVASAQKSTLRCAPAVMQVM